MGEIAGEMGARWGEMGRDMGEITGEDGGEIEREELARTCARTAPVACARRRDTSWPLS